MSIKITSGGALARMQNAIVQGNKAFDHNMEPDVKDRWLLAVAEMRYIHIKAIERNEKYKEIKNAKTL